MPPTGKLRAEKEADARLGHLAADKPGAECEDVRIIMLPCELGGERVVDPRAAALGFAIYGDRNANSRTANRDAALSLSGGDGLGDLATEQRIVDAFRSISAEVGDLVTLLAKPAHELVLKQVTGMISGKGDTHDQFLAANRARRHRAHA